MPSATCPVCQADMPIYPGRRVLCPACGGDFGREQRYPIMTEVPLDDFEPNLMFLTNLVEDASLETC